jgi:hypothetical protein
MRRGASVCLLAAVPLSACSLLTSLDGFTGGSPSDAGATDTTVLGDAATEAEAATVTDASDGGGDAPDRSALYAAAVLADSPRGYWRLEETNGTVAKGETGSYDGIYVAAPLLGEPGVAGSRAMKLRAGTQARMRVESNDFRYVDNKPYTVELWAKVGELKDYQWLSSTEVIGGGARRGWSLLAGADGQIRYEGWRTDDGGSPAQVRGLLVSATGLPSGGDFRHIVMAYTGAAVIGYIDGVPKSPFVTSGKIPDVGQLMWGCRSDLAYCLDDWTIDELAIYDFELKAERVKAHYDLGK